MRNCPPRVKVAWEIKETVREKEMVLEGKTAHQR